MALAGVFCVGPALAEVPAFMQKPSPEHVRVLCYNINWDAIFEDGDPDNTIGGRTTCPTSLCGW